MAMAAATITGTVPHSRHPNAVGLCAPLSRPTSLTSFGAPRCSLRARRSRCKELRAVATGDPSSTAQSSPSAVQQKTQYHFLLANAKFMLDEEEHLQELLRERLRNYGERNKEPDFWLVIEPKFLEDFPDLAKRVNRPAVALVSTNDVWITFMKLRIDRVLKGSYEADSLAAATASNPVDLQFDRPENWTAPYPKYEAGWWTPFLPPKHA